MISFRNFLWYKFFNSLFFGLSVGSIFVLYTPLEPSIYSLGGVALALGMLLVAKLYEKILNIRFFFLITLFVELVILFIVVLFLIFSYSYMTALCIYIGYQMTFLFGSYLVRAETIFFPKAKLLSFIDVIKQKGYLLGLIISYLFYKILEYLNITDKQIQVYNLHIILFCLEMVIIYSIFKAFSGVVKESLSDGFSR